MKKILLLSLASLLATIALAQTGRPFPTLTGTTLEGQTVTLPTSTKGKFTVVGVVFSPQAEAALAGWIAPLYTNFIMDPEYDVNLYWVPMLSGAKEMAAGAVEKRLREGLQKDFHRHVLLYKGSIDTYRQQLRMDRNDTPYFFVLDKEGKVIHVASGPFTEDKLTAMDELVDESWD